MPLKVSSWDSYVTGHKGTTGHGNQEISIRPEAQRRAGLHVALTIVHHYDTESLVIVELMNGNYK